MSRSSRRAWIVWGVALLAYATAIFQRTSLSVAAPAASERFGIGASVLATLAVVQLLTYAGMQIPVGVLLDRFGSRRMLVAGGLVMAAGQAALALATEPLPAVFARLCVGLGDSLTFISVLRVIPAWFPGSQVPLLTQLTGQVGQVGQLGSAIPLVAALAGPGWTPAYLGAAAIGVLVAVIVLLVLADHPDPSRRPVQLSWRRAGLDIKASFGLPGTRLGLWSHLTGQFSGLMFSLLWGFPFLTVGLGYSPTLAGGLLSLMVIAAMVIGPIVGVLTARFPMRRSNLVMGIVALTILFWSVVLLWPGRPPFPLVVALVLVLAAYGPASAVGFDFARTVNPAGRLGTANGIVNVGGFAASLVTIFAIGVILDLLAPTGRYTLGDFKAAFAFQYAIWTFGLLAIWRARRLTRARLRAAGTTIDPLPNAIARRLRRRRP